MSIHIGTFCNRNYKTHLNLPWRNFKLGTTADSKSGLYMSVITDDVKVVQVLIYRALEVKISHNTKVMNTGCRGPPDIFSLSPNRLIDSPQPTATVQSKTGPFWLQKHMMVTSSFTVSSLLPDNIRLQTENILFQIMAEMQPSNPNKHFPNVSYAASTSGVLTTAIDNTTQEPHLYFLTDERF